MQLKQASLASKLATVCAALGEYPSIRFGTSSHLSKDFALQCQDALDEMCNTNPDFPVRNAVRRCGGGAGVADLALSDTCKPPPAYATPDAVPLTLCSTQPNVACCSLADANVSAAPC